MRRDERITIAKRAGLAWVVAIVTVIGTSGLALRANTLEPTAPSMAGSTGGSTAEIPEPASLLLFGVGLLAVARQLRKNRRQVAAPTAVVSAHALATASDTTSDSQI